MSYRQLRSLRSRLQRRTLLSATLAGFLGLLAPSANAQLSWDGDNITPGLTGGTGTWDAATTTNWWDGATNVAWNDISNITLAATFSGTPGTVTVAGPLTANSLTFNVGNYLLDGTGLTLGGATPTITVTNALDTATINTVLSGAAGLTYTGAGTLVLGGNNATLNGAINVNGGILSIAADNNLGAAANGVTINGGTLQSTGAAVTSARVVTLGTSGGTIDVTGANALTLSAGLFANGNSLTKSGTGTLNLSAASTRTGTTAVNSGKLAATNLTALGTGAVTVDGATSVYEINVAAAGNSSQAVTVNNGGTFQWTPNLQLTLGAGKPINVTGTGGTVFVGGSGATGKILAGTGLLTSASGSLFTKTGGGVLQLSGPNTGFLGDVALTAGTIEFQNADSFGTVARTVTISGTGDLATGNTTNRNNIVLAGGTLSGNNANAVYSGSVNVTANSTIALRQFQTTANASSFAISGPITGSSNLSVTAPAAATLTLSGDNSAYSGVLTAGANATVQLNNLTTGSTIPSTGMTLAGGTAAYRQVNSSVQSAGTNGLNATYYNFTSNSNPGVASPQFHTDTLWSLPRAFSQIDATVNVPNGGAGDFPITPIPGYATGNTGGGVNTGIMWKGLLNITTAGSYQFSGINDDNLQLWIDGVSIGTLGVNSAVTNIGGAVSLTAGAHSIVIKHTQGTGGGYARINYNGPDTGATTQILGTTPGSVTTGSLAAVALGSVSVGAGGGTIDIISNSTINSLTTTATGITLNATSVTVSTLDFNGTNTIAGGGVLTVNASTPVIFSTAIGESAAGGALTFSGGQVRLVAPTSNTYTGLTTVSGGQLVLGSAATSIPGNLAISATNVAPLNNVVLTAGNQIADSSNVTISNSGTLSIGAFNETINQLNMSGNALVVGGLGVLTVTDLGGSAITGGRVSANLAGAGGLNFATADRSLILSGNNNYTGSTTITNGSIIASSTNALGAVGSGNETTVSGTGQLQLLGTFAGITEAITINNSNGLRSLGGNTALASTVTLGADSTITVENGSLSLSNGTTSINGSAVNANLTVAGSGDLVLSSAPALGAGTITKTGSGSLVFAYNVGGIIPTVALNAGSLGFTGPQSFGAVAVPANRAYVFNTDPGAGVGPITVGSSSAVIANFAANQAFLNKLAGASTGSLALGADSGNNLDFTASTASLGASGMVVYSGVITPNASGYRFGGGTGYGYNLQDRLTITQPLLGANAVNIGSGNTNLTRTVNDTLTGAVTIDGGAVVVTNNSSLGDSTNLTNANVTLQNGGILRMAQTSASVNANNGTANGAALTNSQFGRNIPGGTQSARGLTIGSGGGTIDVPAQAGDANRLIIPGVVAGSAGNTLNKTGLGSLVLTGTSTLSGDVNVAAQGNNLILATNGTLLNVPTISIAQNASLILDNHNTTGPNRNGGQLAVITNRLNDTGTVNLTGGTLQAINQAALLNQSETLGTLNLAGAGANAVVLNVSGGGPDNGSYTLTATNFTRSAGSTLRFGGNATYGAALAADVGRVVVTNDVAAFGAATRTNVPYATMFDNDHAAYGANGFVAATYTTQGAAAGFAPVAGTNYNFNVAGTTTFSAGNKELSGFKFGNNAAQTLGFAAGTDVLFVNGGPEGGAIIADNNNQTRNIGSATTRGVLTAGPAAGAAGPQELFLYNNQGTLNVFSVITDNPAGTPRPVTLVKAQGGTLTLDTTNTYTGGTFVNAGRLNVNAAGGLGTGAVLVKNAALQLNNPGASTGTAIGAGLPVYTGIDQSEIYLQNGAGVYTTAGDRFSIAAGSMLTGDTDVANQGLNSLTRVAAPTGMTGGDVYLAPGAIIRMIAPSLNVNGDMSVVNNVKNLGTNADLYLNLNGGITENSSITIGPGTPWRGLASSRAGFLMNSGIINATGDFELQGTNFNGGAGTVTLGQVSNAGGYSIVNQAGKPINAIVSGVVAMNEDSPVYMPSDLTFVVTNGGLLQPNYTSSFGFGGSSAKVVVQAGGTLDPGNFTAVGTPANQPVGFVYPLAGPLSSSSTIIEAGGRLLANDASGIGTYAANTIQMRTGSVFEIGNAQTFLGTNAGVINSNQFAFDVGVNVRYATDNVYRFNDFVLGATNGNTANVIIYGANRGLSTQVNPFTTLTEAQVLTFGNGNVLTNDNVDSRAINGGGFGGRLVFNTGSTIAASTSGYFNVNEDIEVPAGQTVTIGTGNYIDGTSKLGGVQLGANFNRIVGDLLITDGAQLSFLGVNAYPDSKSLNLPLAVTNLTGNGILPGTGTSLLVNNTTAEIMGALTGNGAIIGNSNPSQLYTGFGGANYTFNGVVSSTGAQQVNFGKLGAGTMTITGVSTSTGTLHAAAGQITYSGAGTSAYGTNLASKGGTLTLDNSVTPLPNRLGGNTKNVSLLGGELKFIGNATTPTTEALGTLNLTANGLGGIGIITIDPNGSTDAATGVTFSVIGNSFAANTGNTFVFRGPGLGNVPGITSALGVVTPPANLPGSIYATTPNLWSQATSAAAPNALGGAINGGGQIIGSIGTPLAPVRIDILGDTSLTGIGTGFVTQDTTTSGIRLLAASEYTSNIIAAYTQPTNVRLTAAANIAPSDTRIMSLTLGTGSSVTMTGNQPFSANPGRLMISSGGVFVATGASSSINVPFLTTFGNNGAYVFQAQGDLAVNAELVSTGATGIIKNGAGTMTLGNRALNALVGQMTVNEGTVILGGTSNTLYVAQPGSAAFNFVGQRVVLNGGTLDLNGKSQIISDLLSNNTLNASNSTNGALAGTLTSVSPASVTVQANAGTNNFGGQVTGAISLNFTGSSATARTLNLTQDNTFTGTTMVRAGTLRLTDSGALSGTTAIDVNTSTLALDNFGTASMSNRIPVTAPVTLRTGTLSLVGGPVAVTQTVNTLNAAQGTSTLNVNAGNSSEAELSIGNLVRSTGATVSFTSGSGTLGNSGSTFTNPRVMITNVNGNPLALNDGILGGWATDGSNFISYNTNGVGTVGNLTGGFVNYNSTDLSTAGATANVNDGGNRTITASKTVNAFRMNAGAAQTIVLNNSVALNIDTGGILSNTNQAMTFLGAQGSLTAGVADATPDELFINANQNTTTINASITDNGAAPTTLVKSLGGTLTLNPGVSTSGVTNTSGSNSLTAVANPGIFAVGQTVTGTGIPAGTTITAISGTTFTLSQNSTAAVTAITVDLPSIGNTYTGGTFVNGGTLNLSKAGLTGTGPFNIPGDLTISNAIVALTQPNQIAPTGLITLNGNATFRVTAAAGWSYSMANQFVLNGNGGNGQLSFGGGSNAGTLTLTNPNPFVVDNDNITVETVLGSAAIGAYVFAPSSGTTSTLNIGGDSPFGAVNNANITGVPSGGLIKTGSGLLSLAPGASTYGSPASLTQVWDIQAGTLRADSASALGTVNSQTKVSPTGTLLLGGNPVNQTGSVNLAGGTLGVTVNNNGIAGNVLVSADSTINVAEYYQAATGRTLTLSGVVSGSNALTLAGPVAPGTSGVLALSNTGNIFSGTINVGNNTTLRSAPATSGTALGTATINLGGGTLDLRSDNGATFNNTVNLTAGSTINVDRSSATSGTPTVQTLGTLSVTGTQPLNVTAGNNYTLAIGSVTGTGTLVKRGQVATTITSIAPTMSFGFSGPVGRSIAPAFNTATAANVTFTPATIDLVNLSMPGSYITPGSKTFNISGATTVEANPENNSGSLGVTNTTTFNTATLVNNGTVAAIGGPATITATAGISGSGHYLTNGNPLNLAGNVTGGTLKAAGNNVVNLTGTSNNFASGAQVQSGTLKLTPTAPATSTGTVTVFGSPASAASGTTAPIAAVNGTLLLDGTSGSIAHTGNIVNSGLVQASAGLTTVSGAISGTPVSYTPGLLEGSFLAANGTLDVSGTRPVNPGNLGVKLEPRMGQTNIVTQNFLTGWADNNHWVYTGYIKDTDGVFSFAENIDDQVGIWIDGQLVLQNTSSNTVTSTAYTVGQSGTTVTAGANLATPSQNFGTGVTLPGLGSGWHLLEIRMSNGAGGAGPTPGNGFGANYGFGYKDGIGALDGADYIKPVDNGTGNMFVTPVGGKGNIAVDSTATLSAGGFTLTNNTNFGSATAGTSTFNVTANALPGGNDTDNLAVIAPGAGTNIGQLNLAASTITTVNTATTIPLNTNLNVGGVAGSGGRLVLPSTSSLALNGGLNITGSGPASGPTVLVNVPTANSTGTGATVVANGGILAGSGSLPTGGTLNISAGGTLSPGNSPGIIGAGNTTWSTAGNYNWQMLDATGTAGTGFDQLAVTGTLTVQPGFNFNLWSLSSIAPNDVNGNASNFNNSLTQYWVVATTTGGGFTGADLAGVNLVTAAANGTGGFSNPLGSGSFSLIPGGGAAPGSANDVVLKFTASVGTSGTTYTLAAAPTTLNILTGGSLPGSVTIQNTGTGTADTLSFTTLTGTTGNASVATATGTTPSGGPLAQGASTVQPLTVSGIANGSTTITSSVATATNTTLATPATLSGTAGTINVVVGNASFSTGGNSTSYGDARILSTAASNINYPAPNWSSNTTGLTESGGGPAAVATTATILMYNNAVTGGGAETVSMQWRTRTTAEANPANPNAVLSDIVNLTGMYSGTENAASGTGAFVLQMNYLQSTLDGLGLNENAIATSGELRLGWNNGGNWQTAVLGNSTGSPAPQFVGVTDWNSYYLANSAVDDGTDLALFLGRYGVDPTGAAGGVTWAVVNHNSEFAVIPEPSTLVLGGLALLGLAGIGLRRRRLAQQQA